MARRSESAAWLAELGRFSITRAAQLKEKSNQWFDDVQFLHQEARWSAAVYLGGFVIELLLKAALWRRRNEPAIRKLLFSTHELDLLLRHCGDLHAEMNKRGCDAVRSSFSAVTVWSVRIRYNPKRPSAADAGDYLGRIREVRQWLLGKI